jgi:hypothetical protein
VAPSIRFDPLKDPISAKVLNENLTLILEAIGRIEGAIAGIRHEVDELRASMPVGDDESPTL